MENLRSALDYMAHDIYEVVIKPVRDINKEKPQEGVKYFFKIYYGNNAEEKLVGYYYNKKGKEYFSEAFDGETYSLEELTECYWLKEE
jgi:hypothetical protein